MAVEVLAQPLMFAQHAPCTVEYAHAFRGQPDIGTATQDNGTTEFLLHRAQGVGQGRLGDVAGLGRAAEVLVLIERDQVLERAEQVHGVAAVGRPLRA